MPRPCELRITPCKVAVVAGERSGMRRPDWDRRADKAVVRRNRRKSPKPGRQKTDHRSERPPVCTRQHHPKESQFPWYHSDGGGAKETAGWDYGWSLGSSTK